MSLAHLRGLVLVLWTYGLMAVIGLALAPVAAIASRRRVVAMIRLYARLVLGGARLICGLRWELRGEVPRGDVILAAKHQSFLDILILVAALDQPRFVMKKELVRAPVLGFYARRIGCIAVDRRAGGRAVREMVEKSSAGGHAGQLVIYPQGTRVPPGAPAPYKAGVAALQEALALPCVPAATNAGFFWPRKGVWRRPGLAVVEFLEPIEPGLPRRRLMERIEREVEPASDRLLAEARG
ncbi:MAG: lysophospholipid acyltransferase family protein [Pseudomonadota bacterium]